MDIQLPHIDSKKKWMNRQIEPHHTFILVYTGDAR